MPKITPPGSRASPRGAKKTVTVPERNASGRAMRRKAFQSMVLAEPGEALKSASSDERCGTAVSCTQTENGSGGTTRIWGTAQDGQKAALDSSGCAQR